MLLLFMVSHLNAFVTVVNGNYFVCKMVMTGEVNETESSGASDEERLVAAR